MLARAIVRPPVSARSIGKYSTLTTLRPTSLAKTLISKGNNSLQSISHLKAATSALSPPLTFLNAKLPTHTIRNMSTSATQKVDLGNYEVLTEFSLDYAPVTVTKYRSKKTGFQVVVGNHKELTKQSFELTYTFLAAQTNAYFIVATEIFDDSGRPHTLEHLVFLGSKSYPYKGVLDSLANRAGGDGTNAWTADDHTAYTISTAGSEGFLNMLPIYLDHILYPTITKEGFTTEVYHINGKGEEAGVVMSEMQGVEQQSSRVIMRELQLQLYPVSSAYRSETGGMLDALRKLTVEEIRQFHSDAYKPWNVCLHVDGSIPIDHLMRILNETVDPMILANTKIEGNTIFPATWKRPFLETPSAVGPVVEKDVRKVVDFMDKDETVGEVVIAWKGTKFGDHLEEMALDVVTTYLTDSEVAPLNKRFVETATPACTSISFYSEDRATRSEVTCHVSGVSNVAHETASGKSQLERMDVEIKDALKEIAASGVDMERMKAIIERDRRKLLSSAETSVTDVLTDAIVAVMIFDLVVDHVMELMDSFCAIRLFVDNPSIVIIGKPSAALAEKITKEQADLLEATKARLGPQGLEAKAAELAQAQQENDREIPEKMITDFPISDAGKIDWIPVESGVNTVDAQATKSGKVQTYLDQDGDKLPYFVHYSHVQSNFINIRAIIDTTKLSAELMPYVKIYEASLFALAVQRPDGLLNHEEVVKQLTDLTVSYDAGLGIRAKLVQDLPRRKRSGNAIASTTASSMAFDQSKSTSTATGLFNNLTFLPSVAEEMKNNPDGVVAKLQELRKTLLNPSGIRLAVVGNVLAMPEPRTAWAKNFLPLPAVELASLPDSRSTLSKLGQTPAKEAVLVTMPSIEGSFGVAYGKGPHGWDSEEVAACKLAAGVLNALESYFWKHIRGAGLAYGASVDVEEEYGLVTFSVYRSPDAFKAFEAAGKVLKGLADGSTELDANIVDAAKSTMSYTYARREGNVGAAASTVLLNEVFKNIPADSGARTLASLKNITVDQVREAMIKYFVPLFDAKSSFIAVASATGLTDKIQSELKEFGYRVEIRELPSFGDAEAHDDDSASGSEHGSEDEGSEDERMSAAGSS
ncbi:hypothetical protein QFC19_001506 [Naganishia cerealis]|uniref:Uncharacterized protein n=1 Tax=Naganishia cerealis TaxID=610337 RepID=A0ACC2WG98_9TREE|nr:hypothetical protein QFC19_001506 [Naganishia cerealis]